MPTEEEMEAALAKSTKALIEATKAIPDHYSKLPFAGGTVGTRGIKYIERVYCYELYHQWRLLLPEFHRSDFPYALTGEIDKSGYPHFRDTDVKNTKPDFTLHHPGEPKPNLLVVEVKRWRVSAEGAFSDLDKLARYVASSIGYAGGIFLVFGGTKSKKFFTTLVKMCGETSIDLTKIRLFVHSEAGQPAVEYSLESGEVVPA